MGLISRLFDRLLLIFEFLVPRLNLGNYYNFELQNLELDNYTITFAYLKVTCQNPAAKVAFETAFPIY